MNVTEYREQLERQGFSLRRIWSQRGDADRMTLHGFQLYNGLGAWLGPVIIQELGDNGADGILVYAGLPSNTIAADADVLQRMYEPA